MLPIKSRTIFSKLSFTPSDTAGRSVDGRNISLWLEKLYKQCEGLSRRRKKIEGTDENHTPNNATIENVEDLTQSGIDENTKNTAAKNEADA